MPVIGSLVTLAYDGRRSTYFRGELLDALSILEKGEFTIEQMKGSWAGAMGQAQFMPSTFRKYAIDFDGDGRIDLWHSTADVLASAANYLATIGWRSNETWGRPVRLPAGFEGSAYPPDRLLPLDQWAALGLVRADGQPLVTNETSEAALVLPSGSDGPAFLTYENFRKIMNWNRSFNFALAAAYLADHIIDR
jgi:membrane-bound lytic murein transglycosylase B